MNCKLRKKIASLRITVTQKDNNQVDVGVEDWR